MLKKFNKRILLAFTFIVLIFTSVLIGCKKESTEITSNSQQGLSKAEIKQIGTEHNRLMIDIIKQLKNGPVASSNIRTNSFGVKANYIDNVTVYNTLNYVLSNNGYPTVPQDEFSYYINNYSLEVVGPTIANTLSSISNTQQGDIMRSLVANVDNTTDYNTLSQQLAALSNRAYNELSGYDQASTLIAIEVANNSAYMWLPESQGGLGYYDMVENDLLVGANSTRSQTTVGENSTYVIPPNRVKQNRLDKKKVGAVIGADAMGAFFGFCQAALPYFLSGGPVNPVSNGMIAGRALIGGVQASAGAAYGILSR